VNKTRSRSVCLSVCLHAYCAILIFRKYSWLVEVVLVCSESHECQSLSALRRHLTTHCVVSPSLSVPPPAPLYLRTMTLYKCFIIIIIIRCFGAPGGRKSPFSIDLRYRLYNSVRINVLQCYYYYYYYSMFQQRNNIFIAISSHHIMVIFIGCHVTNDVDYEESPTSCVDCFILYTAGRKSRIVLSHCM